MTKQMEWLPYPQNMPKKDGEYIVCKGQYIDIGEFQANSKQYDGSGKKYYGPRWYNSTNLEIIEGVEAFMEKPELYKG